ncbi:hypothetical protein ACRBEV_18800 [Methylobacterium phyllosphaerae]
MTPSTTIAADSPRAARRPARAEPISTIRACPVSRRVAVFASPRRAAASASYSSAALSNRTRMSRAPTRPTWIAAGRSFRRARSLERSSRSK